MRRTMTTLWRWWKNLLVYRRKAWQLAWEDALLGVNSASLGGEAIEELLLTAPLPINPFGRFKEINERLNHEG